MAEQLKVLIVDDSAIYRSLVQGCLREMADVKCVGTAVDGRDAIVKAGELRPEVILLDVEMPVMNGVEAMPKLRSMLPDAGIIMVSSLTTNGANITMDALQAGAFDFVTKPQVRAGEDGFAALREPLGVVIEAFREGRAQRSRPAKSPAKPRQARGKVPVIDVIAIGCSTGGPSALAELIPELPEDLRFTASLATSLDRRSKLRVREAEEGRPLRAGEVLVAPGGKHLEVAMQDSEPFVRLTSGNVVNSFRPSVDVLFKSLSVSMPGRALCVVMTGMGADGLEGVKTVRQRGGWCIAQDQASCAVYGMPRSVVESGEADEVVALDQLAARLQEIAKAK